jgi:hypothetical protein
MDIHQLTPRHLHSTNETTGQEQTSTKPILNPEVTPVWGFMWFTLFLFLFSLFWAGYVLHRLHNYGAIKNWSLPPEERKARREMERKKIVGVRRIWVAARGGFVTKEGKEREGEEGKEMDERIQLERMHTVRKMKQKEKVETKRRILREIERLRLDDAVGFVGNNKELGYGLDLEAQTQRAENPALEERARRIRELQAQLKELETSPTSSPQSDDLGVREKPYTPPHLTKPTSLESTYESLDGTTVFNSTSSHAKSTRPTLTNQAFNRPPSPRNNTYMTTDTWEYNDSPNPEEGEDTFTIFARRAQAFENRQREFDQREAEFSARIEVANGVAERELGERYLIDLPRAVHIAQEGGERGKGKTPLR